MTYEQDPAVTNARDNLWAEIPPVEREIDVQRAITAYGRAVARAVLTVAAVSGESMTEQTTCINCGSDNLWRYGEGNPLHCRDCETYQPEMTDEQDPAIRTELTAAPTSYLPHP